MNEQRHLNHLNNLVKNTQPWHTKFPIEFNHLKYLQKTFEEKLNRFSKEEVLNIAIMGQVKAGKSSFLNTLLFNGKSILPEAATPKTANLTRISYAEKPRLEVDFFSETDWKLVQNFANSDNQDDDTKIAKEQVAMIQQAGINPLEIIQKGTHIQETENLDDIMAVLNDYAGNDGKYTALVKMIRLYLPLPELQGYNIIDTPGMNDPVISRTQRTKEEMSNSDVVFFLSHSNGFLDASDIDLLTSQLPEAGVKRLVLIVSQYDSAIDNDGYNRNSLAETESNVKIRLTKRSQQELGKVIELKRNIGQHQIADVLATIKEPIFVSSYAQAYATLDKNNWSNNMTYNYQALVDIAKDSWNDYQFTQDDWQRIAGFNIVQLAYEQARNDKMIIIEQQKKGLIPEALNNLELWQQRLTEKVEQRIHTLKTHGIDEINQKQTKYEQQIQTVTHRLNQIIDDTLTNIRELETGFLDNLENHKNNQGNLQTYTGTKTTTKSRVVESGVGKFFRAISFGIIDTREVEYYDITMNYEYAKVSDAVEKLVNYTRWSLNHLEKTFEKVIDTKTMQIQFKQAILNTLKISDNNFDMSYFRNIIENAIDNIKLPEVNLNINSDDISDLISSHFSDSKVTGNQYQKLELLLEQSLSGLHKALTEKFHEEIEHTVLGLKNLRKNLAHELTKNIQTELDQLRKDLQERESTVQSYQQLLANLK